MSEKLKEFLKSIPGGFSKNSNGQSPNLISWTYKNLANGYIAVGSAYFGPELTSDDRLPSVVVYDPAGEVCSLDEELEKQTEGHLTTGYTDLIRDQLYDLTELAV